MPKENIKTLVECSDLAKSAAISMSEVSKAMRIMCINPPTDGEIKYFFRSLSIPKKLTVRDRFRMLKWKIKDWFN